MPAVFHPQNIFLYFDNHLSYPKAKNLHYFCIARSTRCIAPVIKGPSSSCKCCCFKCLTSPLLISILLSRGHKKLFSIVISKNYMFVTDE